MIHGRKRKWNNVPGKLSLDVTLEIPFVSSGYYDPGQTCGPPEKWLPPDGEDERTYDRQARIVFDNHSLALTQELTETLLGILAEEIADVEIE